MRENFSVGTIEGAKRPFLVCLSRKIRFDGAKFTVCGWGFIKFIRIKKPDPQLVEVCVGDIRVPLKLRPRKSIPFIKGFYLNRYRFEIDGEELVRQDVQNRVTLDYPGATKQGRIIYRAADFTKGHNRHSRIIVDGERAVYLRQTAKNTLYITQRSANELDTRSASVRIFFAWLFAKFAFWLRATVLMYEKEASRYEESASVVFAKLMKRDAKNVFYVIDKNSPDYEKIPTAYRKHVIAKHSFKHLVHFFASHRFIGTETLGHAIQLRCANRLVLRKLSARNLEYIFLQHGVMYMISLDSDQRTGFYKQDYKKHKVVVSSKLEADHFIKYAGFKRKDLWVTGLAKFDQSQHDTDADKIVIMPTWRRWEANLAATDFTATEYYRMIRKMIKNVPKELRKKLIVMPHPLMLKALESAPKNPLCKYLPKGKWTYDGVLRECRLLITDYSSVAYDAFYRGANVIFCWGEKKHCMKRYGENAHLMLTKKLAFGPVCKNYDELSAAITEIYGTKQARRYINRYRKIVKYHDNHNANRVVRRIIKEGMIK